MRRFGPFRVARRGGIWVAAATLALAAPRAFVAPAWAGSPGPAISRPAASPETLLARGDDYTLSRFWLATASGHRARCVLRAPRAAPPRSVAGAIIVGGFAGGWRAAQAIDPGPGVALLSVDYPIAWGARDPSALEALRRAGELWRATHEIEPALVDAATYLGRHPSVDSSRVFMVGASFGVPFALRAAARSERFRGVALLYGCADLADWVSRNAPSLPPWARPVVGRVLAWLYREYEPARNIARVSPRPVLLVNARGDERIGERQARALYEAAREPREQIWLEGRHLTGLRDQEILRRLLAITLDWARRKGLTRLVRGRPEAYGPAGTGGRASAEPARAPAASRAESSRPGGRAVRG